MRVHLPRDAVHCWYVDLAVPPETEARCYATLPDGERRRSARFRFDRHRRRFVVAHGVLRDLLGRYLETDPRRLRFVNSEFGKPELLLTSGRRLLFNLSHSGDLAAIAVARADVGVDVERLRALPDYAAIAQCQFSDAEVEQLYRLPRRLRAGAFFRCWTTREAHTKALGLSLAHDAPPRRAGAGRWSLLSLRPPPGHVGALVIRGGGWRLLQRRWRADGTSRVAERRTTRR